MVTPEEVDVLSHPVLLTSKKDYESIKDKLSDNICVYFDGIAKEKWSEKLNSTEEKSIDEVLLQGAEIYESILSKYGGTKNHNEILVYNYTGLGDAYVIAMLFELYKKRNNNTNFILTTMSKACRDVFRMFEIQNIELVTVDESNALEKLALLCGANLYIKNLMQSPEYNPYILRRFHGIRFNMFDMYQYYIFNLNNIDGLRRDFPSLRNSKGGIALCEEKGVEKGKSVIISPYAKSLVGFDKNIWKAIAASLIKSGLKVFTNCAENEKEIEGTTKISFPLTEAYCVIDYAGYFVGIRSGFCDVISETGAKKILIYPDYNQFNGLGTYEFCSFERMGFGKNYVEYKIKFEDGNKLPSIILNEII